MTLRWLTKNVDWMQIAGLASLAVVVLFLWDTRVVYPLKILVVFFHEMSHGLAAILGGGDVHRIEISDRIGGVAWTSGGNRFFTASAGYLGSLLWGALILVFSARTKWSKAGTCVLGGVLLIASVWLVRPIAGFGFIFGVLTGGTLIAAALLANRDVNELILRVIGLTSCLYVLYDIKSDILDRPELRSDARTIADITGVPTLLWGVIWLTIALLVATFFVLLSCKKRKKKPPAPDIAKAKA